MAEDAFVTDFEHIMADDITENVRFIMYDSESGKTASAGEVSKYMMRNIHVDSTLTEEGAAADAKATGDEITNVKSDLDSLGLSVADGMLLVTYEEV